MTSIEKMLNGISNGIIKAIEDIPYEPQSATHMKHRLYEGMHMRYITEEFHVIDDFADFVTAMMNDFERRDEKYTYTGWNFNGRRCVESHDKSKRYPIYLRVVTDERNDKRMSIADRVKDTWTDDNILLTINSAALEGIDKKTIKAILFHECRHCLEMYVTDFNTIKDMPFDADNEALFKGEAPYLPQLCANCMELFSLSEQRARADSAVHYLQMSERNYTAMDVQEMLKETDALTLVQNMEFYLDVLKERIDMGMFHLPLIIGLLSDKYKIMQKRFNVNVRMVKDCSDDCEKKAVEVYDALLDNYMSFLLRLKDMFFVHVIQKQRRS